MLFNIMGWPPFQSEVYTCTVRKESTSSAGCEISDYLTNDAGIYFSRGRTHLLYLVILSLHHDTFIAAIIMAGKCTHAVGEGTSF